MSGEQIEHDEYYNIVLIQSKLEFSSKNINCIEHRLSSKHRGNFFFRETLCKFK